MDRSTLTRAICDLGLAEQIICAHTSLSSFGHIDGGAEALMQAYLDAGCTLMVPSHHYGFGVPAPKGMDYPQNGQDPNEDEPALPDPLPVYDPSMTMLSSSMGALPRAVVAHKESLRGIHPHNSFAAVGPHAKALIQAQTLMDVYAPLKLAAQMGGQIVLMGVNLNRCTAIHWAEEMAGHNLFRQWHATAKGTIEESCVGSCSEGFHKLDDVVSPFERRTNVGNSLWRIFPLQQTMQAVAKELEQNPAITHCDDPDCPRCRDMILGGPILTRRI